MKLPACLYLRLAVKSKEKNILFIIRKKLLELHLLTAKFIFRRNQNRNQNHP